MLSALYAKPKDLTPSPPRLRSFPRDVTWYTAPGYSIRNGRAIIFPQGLHWVLEEIIPQPDAKPKDLTPLSLDYFGQQWGDPFSLSPEVPFLYFTFLLSISQAAFLQ